MLLGDGGRSKQKERERLGRNLRAGAGNFAFLLVECVLPLFCRVPGWRGTSEGCIWCFTDAIL